MLTDLDVLKMSVMSMSMLPIVLYLLEFGRKVFGTFCQKQVGVSAILFRGGGTECMTLFHWLLLKDPILYK